MSVVSYSKLEQEKPSWNELESNALQYRFNVLGEMQLEFLWHTALRAGEDYVGAVSDGMLHGGSPPSNAHDCRSEDCKGQLASQPTHDRGNDVAFRDRKSAKRL